MVKKYHQDAKDRHDESVGMKRYERSREHGTGFYGMLSEEHSAPANLPQHVVHKFYPKCDEFMGSKLDDTIRGLDDTRSEDIDLMEKHESKVKY